MQAIEQIKYLYEIRGRYKSTYIKESRLVKCMVSSGAIITFHSSARSLAAHLPESV